MRLTRLAIDNHRWTVIQYAAFLILGVGAITTMPTSEDPPLDPPGTTVIAYYPGTSPLDMERLVVEPLEEEIHEIEAIKSMRATIEDGTAKISIEFEGYTDSDEKYREVREKVIRAQDHLPAGMAGLDVIQWSTSNTLILQMAVISETATYRELFDEAERIQRSIERLGDVKRVDILGAPEQIVRIDVDLEELGQRGLSLEEIATTIQATNASIPGGAVRAGTRRLTVMTSGAYQNLDDIRNTILRAQDGTVLTLADIARVEFGEREHLYRTRFNGERCLFIGVKQKKHTDIFGIVESIDARLEALRADLPPGVRLETGFDQSHSVASRINMFSVSLTQGILLVGSVILVVIGARAAGIVMLAIPSSFLIGIGCVYLAGFGVHQVTIIGLVIALGLLVDNAIVVIESIVHARREGLQGREAVLSGTQQVSMPVASSTLTTVLAFIPIIFLGGSTGDFIRSLPVTVIFTLVASLFVALTLIPLLASRWMRGDYREPLVARKVSLFVQHRYGPVIDWCLRRRWIALALALLLFVGSLALFPRVGVSFFPKAEKPMYMIDIDMPRGTDIATTDEVVGDVEAILLERPETRATMANIGRGNPVVYYNMNLAENKPHVGQIFVTVDEGTRMSRVIEDLRLRFSDFAAGRLRVWEFKQGPFADPPIVIRVTGDNLDVLSSLAADVEDMIRATAGTIYVNNPLNVAKMNLQIVVARDRARMLGLSPLDIDRTVAAALDGWTVGRFRDAGGDEYDLILSSPEGGRATLSALDDITLLSSAGGRVPLSQVADRQLRAQPPLITHYDQVRTARVTADVEGRTVESATQDLTARLATYTWPAGYGYVVSGEQEQRRSSFGGLMQAVVIALVCIYGVLVLQFRSYIQPFVIFAAIPMAIIGSILALLATGYAFSFTAFLGMSSLVGIVINDAILLVDFVNTRRDAGIDRMQAIREAGMARFVPVVLTSATTIGGLLPLTLAGGTMWAPMGWGIIGGLCTATFLTLLVVPVLYATFSRDSNP